MVSAAKATGAMREDKRRAPTVDGVVRRGVSEKVILQLSANG